MYSSPDLSFSRTLPANVFNRLGESLQQMAQAVGSSAIVITEALLVKVHLNTQWKSQKFTVVVSRDFSALLTGFSQELEELGQDFPYTTIASGENLLLNVNLTFNPEAISCFLRELRDLFECTSDTYQILERYCQFPAQNNAQLQSQFTLFLLEALLQTSPDEAKELSLVYPQISVCQSVEEALKTQLAQEQLLNQVTTQIRQSLDLPIIMATAIEQVREFLELDRLVVCQIPRLQKSRLFEFQWTEALESYPAQINSEMVSQGNFNGLYNGVSSSREFSQCSICIVYESRATDTIPSVLTQREDNCFAQHTNCWEKYRQGFVLAVDDVEKTYVLEKCLLTFLQTVQVRAKLVAPIVFEEKLWGLLIAHQCDTPRHWKESEKKLLASVAEQLAIAIHQAELMRSLTQEKQSLEQRVIERTLALRDALVAAQAASRLRSEFLATVSHELLTPLTYVIGMSATLLRWPFGELTQRQRDYLQTIHDSGEHLLEMINDILDLSQIEAGKTGLEVTKFSLTNLAQITVNALQEKAQQGQINLFLDLQIDAKHDQFTADVKRVQKILWNLLSNAVKFTPEGGNVTLRLWLEDDVVVIQVEDTGIGIPEDQLPWLFEKFHQLDTPYHRRYEGTGLGLALTKQLVELHRGRIEVESSVGVGSIFTVWIPNQSRSMLNSDS